MLEGLLTSLVWITANVAYRSCVREGERGFKRFAAFLLGWPGTLVSLFSVRRTKRVTSARVDELEGERKLLMEIRRDRARRVARRVGPDEGEPSNGEESQGHESGQGGGGEGTSDDDGRT